MSHSFGEGYISNVKSQQVEGWGDLPINLQNKDVVTVAGDIALEQLKRILLILDTILFFIVPIIAYFIAGKSLSPIEESYARQKRFVSDASHELRTPLTIMRGELDLALSKERTPEQYRLAITTAHEETLRLTKLTDDLLSIAKSEQSSQVISFTKIDTIDLINEVLDSYEAMFDEKKLKIDFTPPSKSIEINGDESALRQLLTNLVGNAIKFTPQKGNIKILLEQSEKYTQFQIKDTGPGMADKEIKKVLEPFYQGDSSHSEQGFGLGLSICKSIVKKHKGTIHIETLEPNGLKVSIKIPR